MNPLPSRFPPSSLRVGGNNHAHHLVQKKGGGSWGDANRQLLLDVGIDPWLSRENLTWAPNGGGQHTGLRQQELNNRLTQVAGDLDGTIAALADWAIVSKQIGEQKLSSSAPAFDLAAWLDEFTTQVAEATIEAIDIVNESYSNCYAAVLMPDNGYVGVRLVVNTQEHVSTKLESMSGSQLTREYFEVSPAEFCRYEWQPFDRVNNMARALVGDFGDGEVWIEGVEDYDISPYIRDALVDAINRVQIPHRLRTTYRGDLLLGIGFADAGSNSEVDDVIIVSSQVNTEEWHNKVVQEWERLKR